jgi:hypothetical protein
MAQSREYNSPPFEMDASSTGMGLAGAPIPGIYAAPSTGIELAATGNGSSIGLYDGWISMKLIQSILMTS